FLWPTADDRDPRHLDLAFAAALIISVLLSYHILVHDLSILFLALLISVENAGPAKPAAPWSKSLVVVCSLLLWSPLVLILFEFHHLELLVIIFGALLGAVVLENHRLTVESGR
ncbi:MAG: hypothetical protein ACRD2S_02245, partial [Terriglobales bacterium]